jgi:hypothetical protein
MWVENLVIWAPSRRIIPPGSGHLLANQPGSDSEERVQIFEESHVNILNEAKAREPLEDSIRQQPLGYGDSFRRH